MKSNFFGYRIHYFIIFLIFTTIFSCEREDFREGKAGNFFFSTDTVMFDTIFTDFGTPTYKFLVYNPNKFSIQFDSVYFANTGTGFIININGSTSLPRRKITLEPKDSMYVFVQAFIPSGQQDEAFIREDSLVFVSGNQTRNVKIIAFGQNVITFRDETIQSQEWYNTKPYLVFGTLTVDSASILRIGEGVRVYFHRNSRLHIKGTIHISGTYNNPVSFLNNRLEKDYDSIPGQWGGILISGKEEKHSVNYAIIRNATTGLQLGEPEDQLPVKADISNTFISNMSYSALTAYQANLSAQNCVFANAGYSVCSLFGGDYSFLHCTLANYGAKYVMRTFGSKTLIMTNFREAPAEIPENNIKPLQKAYFGNSVVYGNSSEEIDLRFKNGHPFNYVFENCILKTGLLSNSDNLQNVFNKSPQFVGPENENFRLDTLSYAKDSGKAALGSLVPVDLDNHNRTGDQGPDAGAYEREEKK